MTAKRRPPCPPLASAVTSQATARNPKLAGRARPAARRRCAAPPRPARLLRTVSCSIAQGPQRRSGFAAQAAWRFVGRTRDSDPTRRPEARGAWPPAPRETVAPIGHARTCLARQNASGGRDLRRGPWSGPRASRAGKAPGVRPRHPCRRVAGVRPRHPSSWAVSPFRRCDESAERRRRSGRSQIALSPVAQGPFRAPFRRRRLAIRFRPARRRRFAPLPPPPHHHHLTHPHPPPPHTSRKPIPFRFDKRRRGSRPPTPSPLGVAPAAEAPRECSRSSRGVQAAASDSAAERTASGAPRLLRECSRGASAAGQPSRRAETEGRDPAAGGTRRGPAHAKSPGLCRSQRAGVDVDDGGVRGIGPPVEVGLADAAAPVAAPHRRRSAAARAQSPRCRRIRMPAGGLDANARPARAPGPGWPQGGTRAPRRMRDAEPPRASLAPPANGGHWGGRGGGAGGTSGTAPPLAAEGRRRRETAVSRLSAPRNEKRPPNGGRTAVGGGRPRLAVFLVCRRRETRTGPRGEAAPAVCGAQCRFRPAPGGEWAAGPAPGTPARATQQKSLYGFGLEFGL